MNRDIKFRAYRKSTQDMCDVLSINFDNGDVLLSDGDMEDTKDVELMQYAGFSDKDGNLVYEGDIIKTRSGSYQIVKYVVELRNNISEELVSQFTEAEGIRGMYFSTSDLVVGNVFQNPEIVAKYDLEQDNQYYLVSSHIGEDYWERVDFLNQNQEDEIEQPCAQCGDSDCVEGVAGNPEQAKNLCYSVYNEETAYIMYQDFMKKYNSTKRTADD